MEWGVDFSDLDFQFNFQSFNFHDSIDYESRRSLQLCDGDWLSQMPRLPRPSVAVWRSNWMKSDIWVGRCGVHNSI